MSQQSDAVTVTEPAKNEPVKTFTAADIEKARQEEKDKLYGRMQTFEQSANEAKAQTEKLQEQIQTLAQAEAQRQAEREAAEQQAAEAQRLAEEAEMDAKSQIQSIEERWKQQFADRDKQWEAQFKNLSEQRELDKAVLDRERQLNARTAYITQRQKEEEDVIPDLWDLVQGSTPEEIEQSITVLREKSAAILAATQASAPPVLFPGARVTAPPMDNHSDQQAVSFTPEQIRAMPLDQFAKYRDQLLKVRPGQQGPSPY
jgi:DNA repair exonuclease SbcCD ATPase subunit